MAKKNIFSQRLDFLDNNQEAIAGVVTEREYNLIRGVVVSRSGAGAAVGRVIENKKTEAPTGAAFETVGIQAPSEATQVQAKVSAGRNRNLTMEDVIEFITTQPPDVALRTKIASSLRLDKFPDFKPKYLNLKFHAQYGRHRFFEDTFDEQGKKKTKLLPDDFYKNYDFTDSVEITPAARAALLDKGVDVYAHLSAKKQKNSR